MALLLTCDWLELGKYRFGLYFMLCVNHDAIGSKYGKILRNTFGVKLVPRPKTPSWIGHRP